jgi:hypothetical protein
MPADPDFKAADHEVSFALEQDPEVLTALSQLLPAPAHASHPADARGLRRGAGADEGQDVEKDGI